MKSTENKAIEKTYSIGQPIKKLEKGSQHYAVLTSMNRFYVWGSIEHKEKVIFAQNQPAEVKTASNIIDFSCGNSNVVAVTKDKELFGIGSNEHGQLGSIESYAKELTKINTGKIGRAERVYCLGDCTLAVTEDQELYYTGKYSYKSNC